MDVFDIGRLTLALLLGGAIGIERRLRGHAAGAHTNALVAFGAALFVLSAREFGGDAVARVTGQVVAGVGFLAGGVILRDGLRVRGLNSAATIWCVAAIGVFVGLHYVVLAIGGTALLVAANMLFHVIERRVPALQWVPDKDNQD